MINNPPIEILLVEDNPGDIELTQEAFADARIPNRVYAVNDGAEAADFLKRRGAYADAPMPDVILLNLKLQTDGAEALGIIENDAKLRLVPLIILTSSETGKDVVRSYKLRANCYIHRPGDFSCFLEVVKAVEDFWLNAVQLPRRNEEMTG